MAQATWFGRGGREELGLARRGHRGPRRFAPRLDPLEDRALLSAIYPVTNTSDNPSDPHSLRGAIALAEANGGGTIDATGLTGTIPLSHGPLVLTGTLDIEGPSRGTLTVSAGGASRVVTVQAGATATLARLTVTGGSADQGGGIDNAGTLTVTRCVIASNQAQGGQGGGGLFNEAGATLTLDHARITNNQAIAAPSTDVFGGGLLNLGNATIGSSDFGGNKALGGSGLDFFGGSAGGGIDNFGGATLAATDSTFHDNQAVGAAADANGAYFGMGGAVENNAGFDPNAPVPSTARFDGCTFTANVATAGQGGSANGGGINNQGPGATMTLNDCVLSGNQAIGGSHGTGENFQGDQALGGGLLNYALASLELDQCSLIGNQAIGGSDSTPTADIPGAGLGEGGGLTNASASAALSDCLVLGNAARGGSTTAGPGGNALGGGLDNVDPFQTGLTLTVTDSRLIGNAAIAASGGKTARPDGVKLGVAGGGGLNTWLFGTTNVVNSIVLGNLAQGGSGGRKVAGGDAFGAGVAVGTNAYFDQADGATVTFTDSQIIGNLARGGSGGAKAEGGDALGGGMIVFGPDAGSGGSTATLDQTIIIGNLALAGDGTPDGQGFGGGLYIAPGAAVTARHKTLIRGNVASTGDPNVSNHGTFTTE